MGIHQFCPPTYCGNPPILSSELLWESTFYKFGHQPTVGIHQFCPPSCCGNPSILSFELLWESTVYSAHLLLYNVKCFYDFYLAKSPEVKITIHHFKSFCFHLHLKRFSLSTNWLQLHRASRKAAYRTAILYLHGRMGKGKRAVVPACIGRNTFWSNSIEMPFLPFSHFTPALLVAKIREMYPEADGNYMGFKRKGAEEKMSWKFVILETQPSVWNIYSCGFPQ